MGSEASMLKLKVAELAVFKEKYEEHGSVQLKSKEDEVIDLHK